MAPDASAPAREASGAALAATLGLCLLALLPTLSYRFGTDQGVFAYMGGALVNGRWPYLHTWESDFPGLMFLQAAEIFVLGRSIVMFRVFDLAVQLVIASLVCRITVRTTQSRMSGTLAAIVYCLIYQSYGPWNTAQREGFALLFVLAGYWLQMTASRRPAWVTASAIGLGLGVAVLIKPTVLAMALYYLPLIVHLRSPRALRTAVVAGVGLVLPALIVVAVYGWLGGLRDMYEACVAYQAIYTARLRGDASTVMYWIDKASRLGKQAVILPAVFMPFLLIREDRMTRAMLFLGYLGSVYAVFVQGTFAGYHYLPGLGIGAVLIGIMFTVSMARLTPPAWSHRRWGSLDLPHIVAAVLMLAAAGWYIRRPAVERLVRLNFLRAPEPNEFRNDGVFDFTEDYDLAQYLASHTRPDEPVQVWGYESLVYYLADRPASSRFQMTHPLVMRPPGGTLSPMQRRWRNEFVADVTRNPPAYVAVVRDDRWWWAPEERTSEELLDDFPEWKAIIEARYQHEQTIGRYLVYRRTPEVRNAARVGPASPLR